MIDWMFSLGWVSKLFFSGLVFAIMIGLMAPVMQEIIPSCIGVISEQYIIEWFSFFLKFC